MSGGFFTKTFMYLLRAAHIQLVLAYVYVPILIYWGLPISLLGFFGAIVFAPLLAGYLMLSSTLFITQILHIPNTWCAALLNFIAQGWCALLKCGQQVLPIGFVRPAWPILALIPLLGLVIVLITKKSLILRTLLLALGLLLTCVGLKLGTKPAHSAYTSYHDTPVHVQRSDNNLTVTLGPLNHVHKESLCHWWHTKFSTFLYKNFGTAHVTHVILQKPTPALRAAMSENFSPRFLDKYNI